MSEISLGNYNEDQVNEAHRDDVDPFKKYVLLSLALHGSIILIMTVKVFLFPSDPIVFQSALRVDMVSLPDRLPVSAPAPAPVETTAPSLPDKAAPSAATPVKTSAPAEETVVLNPTKPAPKVDPKKNKQQQQAAIAKMKQMSAIDNLEEQFRQDEANKARTYKGNTISKGSELTGLSRLEHDEYVSEVERHVRQFWALPQWLANKDLKAQVRVRFDARGNIIARQLVKSSGNPAFDEVVIDTIEKASPAPAPPERLAKLLEREGILFGFPE